MLEVGQKLWKVYNDKRRGDPCEVEVVKVGRKWATLDSYHGRINVDTLMVDGGKYSSPAKCYLDREDYEAERERCIAFSVLKQKLSGYYSRVPDGVSLEDIKQAEKLLGLE